MSEQETCVTCRTDYSTADPEVVKQHAAPVACSCNRCSGKPECYPCGNMFCKCGVH